MMSVSVKDHLNQFKEINGEEAWKSEVSRLALKAIKTGEKHAAFWKELTQDYDWLDWDSLVAVANAGSADEPEFMLSELLRRQMPGLRSQAQFDAATSALETVQILINSILEREEAKEAEARKALDLTLSALKKVTDLTQKLDDLPEGATSSAAEAFKARSIEPPTGEQDTQRQLLSELIEIKTTEELNTWYKGNRKLIDEVKKVELRNPLLDAIRKKKNSL